MQSREIDNLGKRCVNGVRSATKKLSSSCCLDPGRLSPVVALRELSFQSRLKHNGTTEIFVLVRGGNVAAL